MSDRGEERGVDISSCLIEGGMEGVGIEMIPSQEEDQRGLRVDIRIRGLEETSVVSDVDVRCIYPDAHSYRNTEITKLLDNDEKEKRDRYQKAVEAEGNRFRPFVVSTDGVLGPSARQLLLQIGDKLAEKWKKPRGTVGAWVRAKMSLAIVRACSACIRGSKVPGGARARRGDPEMADDAADGAHLRREQLDTVMIDDESDGAFLGLQFSNGPAGQGRCVQY